MERMRRRMMAMRRRPHHLILVEAGGREVGDGEGGRGVGDPGYAHGRARVPPVG